MLINNAASNCKSGGKYLLSTALKGCSYLGNTDIGKYLYSLICPEEETHSEQSSN